MREKVEHCISCGCVVDKEYHGHHSAADCRIMKFAESYAKDTTKEARELSKEMRRELEDAKSVMEKYEAQLTGELFNDPSLNAILEKSKDYA